MIMAVLNSTSTMPAGLEGVKYIKTVTRESLDKQRTTISNIWLAYFA